MKFFCQAAKLPVVLSVVGLTFAAPAMARPPTVTNSPGYDARLAEQRAVLLRAEALKQNHPTTPRRRIRTPRQVTR